MWHGEYDGWEYVICDDCGATKDAMTAEEAASAWNMRVYEGNPGSLNRRVQDDEADDGK